MNYIKHLTGFFEKVANDRALNPTHVSLYMAMFQFWNCNRFKNPISISRDEVMRISKISSKSTYHKCLKKLHYLGYINYEPSYNPFRGSHVHLFNFSDDLKPTPKSEKETTPKNEPINGQVTDKLWTSIETSTGQAVVPSINNTNNTNISKGENESEHTKKINEENTSDFKNETQEEIPEALAAANENQNETWEEKKLREKKKEIHPTIEMVLHYFQEQNFDGLEAQKFHNYFSSNGWLVGGKTPMVDWKAAAQNWMINAQKFNPTQQTTSTNHLHSTTNKNYAEPL